MKDAYYFSHDSNAKDDPKCVLLIEQLGLEGYGIFWVLIETLRDQPEYKYPLALIPALSRRYNTTTEKMKTVVSQYGLFDVTPEGEFFFSESLCRRMESLSTFRESQRKKALKRWNNAPALPRECNGNADPMPVKESKVKKSKVKDSKEDRGENDSPQRSTKFIIPTVQEISSYCSERKNGIDAQRFFDFYESKGWMIGKNRIKDWKACVRTWEQRDKQDSQAKKFGSHAGYTNEDIELWENSNAFDYGRKGST